jgi:hypothetical protein
MKNIEVIKGNSVVEFTSNGTISVVFGEEEAEIRVEKGDKINAYVDYVNKEENYADISGFSLLDILQFREDGKFLRTLEAQDFGKYIPYSSVSTFKNANDKNGVAMSVNLDLIKIGDKYAKGSTVNEEVKDYVVMGSVSTNKFSENFSKIIPNYSEYEAIQRVKNATKHIYAKKFKVKESELKWNLSARERGKYAKGSTVKGGEEKWFCLSYKVDGKPKKQYFTNKNEMNSAIKSMKSGQWRENYTDIKEINSYAKGSTIKNKYEHNDFPIMFVEIPFGYGKKQGMLVTKLYNLLKKHNIAIDNSKEWHTKGFGEEYENDENHNIIKFNVNDAPNPKKLTEILWNLPNGEYYVSATKDYKYANGSTVDSNIDADKLRKGSIVRMFYSTRKSEYKPEWKIIKEYDLDGIPFIDYEADCVVKRVTPKFFSVIIPHLNAESVNYSKRAFTDTKYSYGNYGSRKPTIVKYANGGGIKVIRRISNNNKVVIDDNFPKNKLIFIGDDDLRLFLESKGYNFGYEGEPTNTNSDGDTYYNFEDLVKSYGFKMHFANNGKGRFDGWNYLVGTNDWIDYNLKSGNLDKSNIKYANGGGVGILEQRIALAKKKSKVAKDGKYFGGEVYLVLQHKTDPEEIFVISQFNYNIDKHNNKWNDYNIVFKTNEYANGGVLNGNYLDTISNDKKNEILKNIANHYGISVAEAKAEVIDADAEMLYEYIANDKSLKMSVYNDFEYGKFAKGTTVKGGGGEGEFWAVASGRKLMGAFPNKKPKQSQYRLVGTGHGWNIKPYAEVQKEGAKDREFEKWELVKEPTDYYLIVEHDYTSGRETNFYQKPKNKYVNGGNTSIRKQKMETTNETRNRELNELQKQMLVNETDKVLFLTVEEIEEIQVLLSQMEDKSLSKEERDELFIKALDIQLKKEINGKTYYTIGYTAKNKGRNYGWRQATEIFNKLRKIGVDAMICQYIPLFSPNVPQSVEDFSFSVLTSPMLSYNSYKELLGGDSESIGEQGDPKNNYYYEDGGNTSSGYSYSIGGL